MAESKAIAFFPWWSIEQEMTFGSVRLFQYLKKKLPGDNGLVSQNDIDDVISAYSFRPNARVSQCALLEVDEWKLGGSPDAVVQKMFLVRDILGFSTLAARSLFREHSGYCSFHNFLLVVQRFREGQADTFAYTTRRRDGGSINLWSSDEFAFQRPIHVNTSLRPPRPQEALVALLLRDDVPPSWFEAIREFNHANTDSLDVPLHVETVMMKSAFEQLLGIGVRAEDFERALKGLLPEPRSELAERVREHSLSEKWRKAFPRSARPIYAWAREFCARRGGAAHGGRKGSHYVWSEESHLAFCSIFFPLILKRVANSRGMYEMQGDDMERLERIDEYVVADPMGHSEDEEEGSDLEHPWVKIDNDIELHAIARRMWPYMAGSSA